MALLCGLVASAFAAAPSRANDRPYQATWTAAADEDDDGMWSIESWATRLGSLRTINLAPEYAFSPTTSLQLEMSRAKDREGADSAWGAELEFKHLFNHIARDGFGWGVVATLTMAKPSDHGWRRDEWSLKLPLSVSLWGGDGLLHANVSRNAETETGHHWGGSLALEGEVWRRTRLFAELAQDDGATLLHTGVRYWVKHERFAIDFSLQRERAHGSTRNGAIVGVGWYDL